MTLYLLKVHLQTFLSIPVTQKCQILSCDTLVANERYVTAMFNLSMEQLKYTGKSNFYRFSLRSELYIVYSPTKALFVKLEKV